MKKITEAASGLKVAAYTVHHNEYIKGFMSGVLGTAGSMLLGLALADAVTIARTYVKNKQ